MTTIVISGQLILWLGLGNPNVGAGSEYASEELVTPGPECIYQKLE